MLVHLTVLSVRCDHTNSPALSPQAIMLAVMKKLTYDDEYNFENEVSFFLCCRLLVVPL